MVVRSHLLAALVLLAASATASGGGWHEHRAKAKARLEPVRAALGASLVDSVAAELGVAVVVRASAGGAWGSHRQCSRWSCGRWHVMFMVELGSVWDDSMWCVRQNTRKETRAERFDQFFGAPSFWI
jgi:hypothetical protein